MLTSKILESFNSMGLKPVEELLEYAEKCDMYGREEINLDDLQISMMTYLDKSAYRNQALSRAINRGREPQMGDSFTESLNMAFQSILSSSLFNGLGWHIESERNFNLKNNQYLKPDVGCFNEKDPIFIIECKTNLGYERYSWLESYERKLENLVASGLDPRRYFLCVLTESNWNGFPDTDVRTGKQWFTFCKKGTWIGGKNNAVKLSDGMHKGRLQGIVETLIESL